MLRIIKPVINWTCYVVTIVSFLCLFVKDTTAVIIAVTVFVVLLLVIAIYILVFIYSHLKKTNNEFIGYATFVKYETKPDGKNIEFEVYRQIQCKQLVMSDFKHSFKWTGTKPAEISSNLQKTNGKIYEADDESYDHVKLNFKKALTYNETATIHFLAKLDDVDDMSKPFVEFRVEVPLEIIHFRVILKHKPDNYRHPASLKRRKIKTQTGSTDYQILETISFDETCKSYEYHLLEPEVGYFYRIEWKK